jgi:hypothetical protein
MADPYRALTVGLTTRSPFGAPGIAPLTSSRLRSTSIFTRSRFSAVACTSPCGPPSACPSTPCLDPALADGARVTMRQRVAVSRAAAAETVAFHHALVTLADGRAGHVDPLDVLEQLDLQLGARLEVGAFLAIEAEFPKAAARGDAGLLVVAGQRLVHALRLLGAHGDLHGVVAVGLHRSSPASRGSACTRSPYRDRLTGFREHAGHARFLPTIPSAMT